jgi:hypothetical protein
MITVYLVKGKISFQATQMLTLPAFDGPPHGYYSIQTHLGGSRERQKETHIQRDTHTLRHIE